MSCVLLATLSLGGCGAEADARSPPVDFCHFPTCESGDCDVEHILREYGALRLRLPSVMSWPAARRWSVAALTRDFGSYALRSPTHSDYADVDAAPEPPPPGYEAYYPPGTKPYNATEAAAKSALLPRTIAELLRGGGDDGGDANARYAVPFRTRPFMTVRRRDHATEEASLRCKTRKWRRTAGKRRATIAKEHVICGMLEDIRLPSLLAPRVSKCVKAGVMISNRGGAGLGFHAHGLAINSQLFGYKRWFVIDVAAYAERFPASSTGAGATPAAEARYRAAAEWYELGGAGASNPTSAWVSRAFDAPRSHAEEEWAYSAEARVMGADDVLLQCVQRPGDLIVVADDVPHAVLSVAGSVGLNLQPTRHSFDIGRPHFFASPCVAVEEAADAAEAAVEAAAASSSSPGHRHGDSEL